MKLCLQPFPNNIKPSNGIGRIVYAQYTRLPALGFEFVENPLDADLCIGHTQQFNMPRMDVLHVHGFYWLGDLDSGTYTAYHAKANMSIVEAARRARAITVPSRWVGECFRRDMRIEPVTIGHGIDLADWKPGRTQEYILWNKNRAEDVCSPIPPYELAKRGLPVLSTFAPKDVAVSKNMQLTGVQHPDEMKQIIQGAALYLATTKETFGIGTIEAMACGVPVIGFDWGGTREIVTNGYDGILVRPHDYDALYKAAQEAYSRRDELSAHARETAEKYDWPRIMQQYAELYQRVHDEAQHEARGVSVVITAHNYGRYITEAIDSVLAQTRPADEVIVVDDGSTDDTLDRLATYRDHVKVISQPCEGVASARTAGLEAARQPFVTLLDADDKLAPTFVEKLLPALQADRGLGIAYSAIMSFNDNGETHLFDFKNDFDWEKQAEPSNPPVAAIPSACMFRREMWKRAGPHKQEYAPGEDTEFWTRALACGFTAQRVTNDALFLYRIHLGSASRTLTYRPIDDRLPWMRDKRYPFAAPSKYAPLVCSYSEPRVSIIVTLDRASVSLFHDTVDSILGQTMREWQIVAVLDGIGFVEDKTIDRLLERYPFVVFRTLSAYNQKSQQAAARNLGLENARADLVLFLNCGDMLTNSALEEMLQAHVNSGGRYVYTDTLRLNESKHTEIVTATDYQQTIWHKPLHGLTALLPTDWAREIGFQDVVGGVSDFYSRLALAGYCGQHLGRALVITRHDDAGKLSTARKRKMEGMTMGSCCGGNAAAILAAKQAIAGMNVSATPAGKVRLEYVGANAGSVTYRVNGHEVRGGKNDVDGVIDVDEKDANAMMSMGLWKPVSIGVTSQAQA